MPELYKRMSMRSLLTVLLILFSLQVFPQKKSFTLQDVISGGSNYTSFYPEKLAQLQWLKNCESYSYVKDNILIVTDAKRQKVKAKIGLNALNKFLDRNANLAAWPDCEWHKGDVITFWLDDSIHAVFHAINPFKMTQVFRIAIPLEAENTDVHFLTKKVVYTLGNSLYMADESSDKIVIEASCVNTTIYGQSVHRNEFGIHKGTFWSPGGDCLAFYKKDESMVGDYPLVDVLAREAEAKIIKYPMAGMETHQVSIGIYKPTDGDIHYLNTGEPLDRYFTNLAWSKEGERLFVAEINREQNYMKMEAYDVKTGKHLKTLFEEKHPKYVEPQHPLVAVPGEEERYIWQSRRDGYNHLYLINQDGKVISQLGKGDWEVIDFHDFSADGSRCFATTTIQSPIERHPVKIDLRSNTISLLATTVGTHMVEFSPSGRYMLDTWSNLETPGITDLVDVKTSSLMHTLHSAPKPYKDFELGETSLGTLTANDGSSDLYYRMIKPTNFDSTKKYPVIVYVYGGPHAQLVHNKWMGGARMWQHYMAQKGYVSFTLDNRGSANRGADFENVIHRQLGQVEMKDQLTGVNFLKSLSFVDAERMGVHGWSYGGFMTTSLMTWHPDVFKVGVAGGPVIDWKYYEIMYGERYMDMPQENPKGYEQSSLLNRADKLKGRLLMIHGAQDPTVVWQHSLAFVEACIQNETQLDYFVYPTHKHNVRGPDRVHLMQKVSNYFDDFLK